MAAPQPHDDRVPSTGDGSDADLEARRRALEASLKVQADRRDAEAPRDRRGSDWGQALKLASEFVAGVLVGAGLGWGIDRLAGTSPWGMIVFLLLGFAAGVVNVMRAAGRMAEPGTPRPPGQA